MNRRQLFAGLGAAAVVPTALAMNPKVVRVYDPRGDATWEWSENPTLYASEYVTREDLNRMLSETRVRTLRAVSHAFRRGWMT